MVGLWHYSSGTILGQHQWVMSRAWEHRAVLVVVPEGCDTGASLVTMNSGFPKSQDLRLLAGPRLCSQLPFLGVILVVSLEH